MHELTDEQIQSYMNRVIGLTKASLGRKLRKRVDAEEVAQSVFRTLIRRQSLGKIDMKDYSDLWALFALLTIRKVRDKAREHTREKRDVRREVAAADQIEINDRIPGPVDACVFADLLAASLEDMPELSRKVVELALAGHSKVAIARELNVTRATVQRTIGKIRERLIRLGAASDE